MAARVIGVPAKSSEVRVSAKVGEIVILELAEPGTAGYRYKATLSDGLSIPIDETLPVGDPRAFGASSRRRLHLRAQRAGRFTMALHLVRPWQRDEAVRSHLVLFEAD